MTQRVVIFRSAKVRTGGERFLAEVHAYLSRQGVQVIPIWWDSLPTWPRRFGLAIDCLVSNLWLLRQVRRLPYVPGTILFQDFHLHPRLWLCNDALRRGADQPSIVVLTQSSLFYHDVLKNTAARKIDEWLVRRFFNQANLVLCNSVFSQTEVIESGVPRSKTCVVYCGIDGEIRPSGVVQPRSLDGKYHLLFVGQCAAIKGLEFLVQSVSMLNHSVVLDIVGNTAAEPDYFARLTRLIAGYGISDRVSFHGHVGDTSELSRLFEQADAFVLPSLVEGFGIVLLEAMSFGLPIVATKVGAVPELVRGGENGLLVPPKDPNALASAIDRLLSSPTLRRDCGQNGLRFVQQYREFYAWDSVGERIVQALELAL